MIFKTFLLYKQIKPDLVHVHKVKEHFIGLLSQIFALKTKPLIRTIHGLNRNPAKEKLFSRLKWLFTTFIDRILIRFFSHSAIAVSDDMFSYLRSFKPPPKS